jgi:flagella basal body P-ring formation protein FlgA
LASNLLYDLRSDYINDFTVLFMTRFIVIFAIAFLNINAPHAEPQWQSHESIYEAVKSYVAQNINTTTEYEINLVPLVDHLNLPLCSQPIKVFTPNLVKPGRTAVNVRCNVGKTWATFVSVMVTPFENVVVLTQPLQRGETVTARHVSLVRKDVSSLQGNYLTQLDSILNKQVVRNLPTGTVVFPKDVVEPKLIKRGERVVITASKSGLGISMNGIAQSDGSRGQLIHVKNQNSGRVISAVVTDVGQVSVTQ